MTRDERLLVALSGGADSVALLCVLLDLGFSCEAAHCNFHLRGEESDRDEAFVRQLAQAKGVKLHVVHFETERYAQEQGVSIEMAARELRYAWFERVRQEQGLQWVAVAHHRDDSVETVMLNLIRGTGINGLRGIQPKNGRIVRPLLRVSRKEIVDYLKGMDQGYVTDSTNLQDEYMRNKIRLHVLPLLEEINPSVMEGIADTAERLTGVAEIYRAAIAASIARVTQENRIDIALLLQEVAPENVLYEVLYPMGFNAAQIKDVMEALDGQTGKRFFSQEYTLLVNRNELVWKRTDEVAAVPKLKCTVTDGGAVTEKDPCIAQLDADLIKEPLVVRRWQPGDRFVPLGMKGWKKVRDYLRDRKLSRFEKEEQCVVCMGNEIVWLVNERIDNRFKVTDATQRIMRLEVE